MSRTKKLAQVSPAVLLSWIATVSMFALGSDVNIDDHLAAHCCAPFSLARKHLAVAMSGRRFYHFARIIISYYDMSTHLPVECPSPVTVNGVSIACESSPLCVFSLGVPDIC